MAMPKVAIVAALEREVGALVKSCKRVEREYHGRKFVFFEQEEMVVICGGIGVDPARRAAEAVFQLYQPVLLHSVGFAGALNLNLCVGDIIVPAAVVDARDGSRIDIPGGSGILVTFMAVSGSKQKASLARIYGAYAVDMEAAAVAAAAHAHGIGFQATKVISDELNFEIPEAEHFIDPQGRFRTVSFALFVAVRPWLWARVAQLAGNSRKAARKLHMYLAQSLQPQSAVVEANIP